MPERKDTQHTEKQPYFEWVIISVFLIILAFVVYLIKPSVEPQNEFNSPTFELTKIPENNITKTPGGNIENIPEKLVEEPPQTKTQSTSQQVARRVKDTDISIIEPSPAKEIEENIAESVTVKELEENITEPVPVKEVEEIITEPVPVKELEENITESVPVKEVEENITEPVPIKEIVENTTEPVPIKEIVENTTEPVPAKNTNTTITIPVTVTTPPKTYYLTIPEDTLWEISETNYGSPFFWPIIYCHNISKIPDPDKIEIGINLELPKFGNIIENLSSEEKSIISENYYQVYLIYKKLGNTNADNYLSISKVFQLSND